MNTTTPCLHRISCISWAWNGLKNENGLYPIFSSLSFLAVGLLLNGTAFGQGQVPVFPELEGSALIDAMHDAFEPTDYLTYSDARDTLFARIYARDDSLSGIFTDHTLYLDPALDPTQAVFMNGLPDGINTEHIWPQSKGAGEPPARIDMHNLYPARVQVNTDRASLPFLNIEDQETVEWYYKDQSMTSIPDVGIDRYSERSEAAFEPREIVKGNVARTMMYFRVIYRDVADLNFFEVQRERLCNWHINDPIDSLEWAQNALKAMYQGNDNPFVLDCSTVRRAFCPDLPSCTVDAVLPDYIIGEPNISPNPTSSSAILTFTTKRTVQYSFRVITLTGRLVFKSDAQRGHGRISHQIDLSHQAPGMYQIILKVDEEYVQRMRIVLIQ